MGPRFPSLSILAFAFFLGACGPPDRAPDSAADGTQESDAAGVPAATPAAPSTEDSASPGSAEPPDATGRSRVVVVGTSLTAGLGLRRDAERYTDRLQAMADSAGYPVEVVNAGVSGETSAGGLRRIDWILREPLDVLVVELGANDGLRGQDPEALEANLLEIVRRTRKAYPDARVVIAGMEAPPNLGDVYTGRFRDVFLDVARTTDAALVPFLLDGVAGVDSLNQADGIHPTAEGHRLIARNVWSVLESVLAEVTGELSGDPAGDSTRGSRDGAEADEGGPASPGGPGGDGAVRGVYAPRAGTPEAMQDGRRRGGSP